MSNTVTKQSQLAFLSLCPFAEPNISQTHPSAGHQLYLLTLDLPVETFYISYDNCTLLQTHLNFWHGFTVWKNVRRFCPSVCILKKYIVLLSCTCTISLKLEPSEDQVKHKIQRRTEKSNLLKHEWMNEWILGPPEPPVCWQERLRQYMHRWVIRGSGDSWGEQDTGELNHSRWDKRSKTKGEGQGR